MVILHIKKGNTSLFMFEAKLDSLVENVTESVTEIYNGCLKVKRICSGIERLRDLPAEQKTKLHEVQDDEIHSENVERNRNLIEERKLILNKTMAEAKGIISKEQMESNVYLTLEHIHEAVAILKGAIEMAFPHTLPLDEPVRCELENRENLAGSKEEKEILHPVMTQLWFARKALENGKKLSSYFGKNEKTKIIVKLERRGNSAPSREPILSEEENKKLMLAEFKRREERKKLEEDDDNSYLDSAWADNLHLKKSLHGVQSVSWKP